jgi:hypothetical protein
MTRAPTQAQGPALAPAKTNETDNAQLWAVAMNNVAGDLTANLANVSPEQRRIDRMWAEALRRQARDLAAGANSRLGQRVRAPAAPIRPATR